MLLLQHLNIYIQDEDITNHVVKSTSKTYHQHAKQHQKDNYI